MSTTQENLMTAFAGESQANRKYLAFAKKAEAEGKPGLAKLFRAAAEGETVHALNYLLIGGKIGSSLENVQGAIQGETYEINEMYPGFVEQANTENNAGAAMKMGSALKVEQVHQQLFKAAEVALATEGDIELKEYFVCGVCGYPAEGEAPEKCPICGAPREKFTRLV
ncbi:rubrerythrin family protein [Patescibacteria group bacterium]|nr:MAG: rubrerythrin family protein [Patescibacteria group bacterium]